MNSDCIGQLKMADWEKIIDPKRDLKALFNLTSNGEITQKSYRPHVLLFDEYYTELYHYKKALDWVNEADTIIFMGTSNSVGFTETVLDISVNQGKKVIVVDPSPSPSFFQKGVEFEMITAFEYISKIKVN
jgi:NAD-dependent deacetylase